MNDAMGSTQMFQNSAQQSERPLNGSRPQTPPRTALRRNCWSDKLKPTVSVWRSVLNDVAMSPADAPSAPLAGGSAPLPILMGCMPDRSNHSGNPTKDVLKDANQAVRIRRFRAAPRQHKSILKNSTEKAWQSNRLQRRAWRRQAQPRGQASMERGHSWTKA